MNPFQAWIIPVAGNPPGIWGGGNQPFPTPPIHIPGQPPGTWGGAGEPFPGYGLPGTPPGIWGGGNEPFPGYGLPGGGKPPTIWPPTPDHPIVIPPLPDVKPPDVKPEHPIVIPPPGTTVEKQWRMVFSPLYGWIWALIPGPTDPQPKK